MTLEYTFDETLDAAPADRLARYLTVVLRDRMRLRPTDPPKGLPVFLTRAYKFHDTKIAGRHCLFLLTGAREKTPSDIAKHVRRIEESTDAIIIYAPAALSARNRARLIEQGVAFAVPGNQLFVPELAMDLREHFRTAKPAESELLPPAAQVLLFHYLLEPHEIETTPGKLGDRLGYSAMTMGRAFDDLAAAGAAQTRKIGRERHIHWKAEKRELLEMLTPALQGPVRKRRFIAHDFKRPEFHLAGETALAEYTNLSPPRLETWAASAAGWKTIVRAYDFKQVDEIDADVAIETWAYDPAALTDGMLVDPLSLYAQFKDHEDERVAQAAEHLLEKIRW